MITSNTNLTTNTITVKGGVTANITIEDLNIDVSSAAFSIEGGSTVNLKLSGTNTLKSGNSRAGINLSGSSNLTIDGTGSLTATGGEYGAGIGSGYSGTSGNISITGGEITAIGGYFGAGIGSGHGGTSGDITISGSSTKVEVKGNTSHDIRNNGSVTIKDNATLELLNSGILTYSNSKDFKDCTITGAGAGADGGKYDSSGNKSDEVKYLDKSGVEQKAYPIKYDTTMKEIGIDSTETWYYIKNGDTLSLSETLKVKGDINLILEDNSSFTVTGKNTEAGITVMDNANFTIYAQSTGTNKGSITATGGDGGAGIGSGDYETSGNISITGGYGGAGIGSGNFGTAGVISITGGDITATGGYDGAGIGSGTDGTVGDISISGTQTKVKTEGSSNASDIGKGYYDSGSSIDLTISGGASVELVSSGTDVNSKDFKDCTITGVGAGDDIGVYDSDGKREIDLDTIIIEDKEYDGNTDGVFTSAKIKTSGSELTYISTYFDTITSTFTDKNVGNNKTGTVKFILSTTGQSKFYFSGNSDEITKNISNGKITAKTLTGTPDIALNSGKTIATASATGLNIISGDPINYKWFVDNVEKIGSTSNTYTIQKADYGKKLKVEITSDETNITGNISKEIDLPSIATTPTATFDAESMDLSGVTSDMSYSVDGGLTWSVITRIVEDLSFKIITTTNGIKVKNRGDGSTILESDVQEINITKGATPTATSTDETKLNGKDGKITNVDTTMEYKKSTDSVYTSIIGTSITGLEPGSYDIRVKASGTRLSSDIQTITIDQYDLVEETTPSATFEASTMELSNVGNTMAYSLDSGLTWTDIMTDPTDMSLVGLIDGSIIRVKTKGDNIYTKDSQVQTITLTKGATPTATSTNETKLNGKDGKITNVDNTMEYKKSTDVNYTDITGTTITGLEPGDYNIRRKAAGTKLTSDIQTITIKKYISYSGGGSSSTESNTDIKEIDIKNKINAGEKDIVITKNKDNITISREAITVLKNGNINSFKLIGNNLELSFDKKAIEEIYLQSTGSVKLEVKKVEKLSDLAKIEIENRPVYDIKVSYEKSNKTEYISNYKEGKVTIGINYKNGKSPYGVYIPTSGIPEKLDSKYIDNKVEITRNTLSVYGIGEKKTPIDFEDIKNHWGKENIDFITSRGMFKGTSEVEFSPNAPITRGMFITVIGRLSGEDIGNYKKSSFTDVGSEMYYSPYIEWAVENKIVTGVGNNKFEPNRNITREELAKMLKGFSDTAKYKLEENQKKIDFTDKDTISDWSKESIEALQKAGIINGLGDNTFAPKGTATRAEAATMLGKFTKDIFDKTPRYWNTTTEGKVCYINWNGEKVVGLKTIDSKKYYFETDGTMVSNKTIKIEGKDCYFGEDGVMVEK